MSNTAAVLTTLRTPLSLESRDIPTPSAHQLVIRNHALAINPVDWKIAEHGHFVKTFPNVLGSDISGIVESVGPNVTIFKKGDRVAAFAGVIASNNIDEGAFQEYTLVYENAIVKLPENISFEEGSVLPMAVATAGIGIFTSLSIPRLISSSKNQSGGFLVWGGSSSVGTAAIQIAHALGFTVFAVSSPHHHEYLQKLGAKATFNYNDSTVIGHIIAAAKEAGVDIKYAFDAVSTNGSQQQVAKVVEAFGGGKVCLTLPWPENAEKPSGVEVVNTGAYRILTDQKEVGGWLFNEWLAEALVKKTFVPSPAIEIVEGGIEGVQKALELLKKGVSGKKLVVPLK
ncbi:hypothetical protein MMC30_002027 [Trapelia coarctata]|nr:hypothetical protein [Trapelia coarctata]